MITIATCGHCKRQGLQKVTWNSQTGQALESHYRPNERTRCNGPASTNVKKK